MFKNLELDAQLVVTVNDVSFVVVAEENYLIVNFKEFNSLDRLLKLAEAMNKKDGKKIQASSAAKAPAGGPLKKLNELNAQIRDMGLVVDIRVGNKTYVELGSGKSARITAAAIFGKIGSFFGK